MGKKSPPKPPNPRETSAAATSTNVGTAVANAFLGNVNEVTPDGTLTFAQTGDYDWFDPYTGKTFNVPTFTSTQTLNPTSQAALEAGNEAELNLSRLARDLSGQLGGKLTDNFTINNESTEGRLFDLGRRRLDPMFAERQESLRQDLANRGIQLGSSAYDTAQRQFSEGQNDAYTQLLLRGRGQATQEQFAEDNQRINQISALLSGGQVSQPNFLRPDQPNIPTTDVAGLINQNYQQRLANWQAKQAATGSLLGGLFSLGSGFLSDERLKKDVTFLGKLKGHAIYAFRYLWEFGTPRHVGVMAQEVEHTGAVTERDGIKFVDYSKLFGAT